LGLHGPCGHEKVVLRSALFFDFWVKVVEKIQEWSAVYPHFRERLLINGGFLCRRAFKNVEI
jgi:hypothetical protein